MAMYVIPGCLLALLYVKIFIIIIFVYTNSFKGKLSDSFTYYNYVGNTKVSVSIKKT